MNKISINSTISSVYLKILRPVLFKLDPEKVHNAFIGIGRFSGEIGWVRQMVTALFGAKHSNNRTSIFGKTIGSPILLSAGFDKNADLVKILPSLGFGGAEIGTVTLRPYRGNDDVRLTRVPKVKGVLVNFGLYSLGAPTVFKRFRGRIPKEDFLWGLSIAPTNDSRQSDDIPELISEYIEIHSLAENCEPDYITLNISCPNTKNGQPFLEPTNLRRLLVSLDARNPKVPATIKLSPDLSDKDFDEILNVAKSFPWLKGVICSNLLKKFDRNILPQAARNRPGGLSGPELFPKMLERIERGRTRTGDRFVWIACGGVSSAHDIELALKSGATAIQLITAMIYQGPSAISKFNLDLAQQKN
jgi:dihydroorotate dehydrogenase